MQTIEIEQELYHDIIKYGIDIQAELKEVVAHFMEKKRNTVSLSEKEIKKIVENSQRIEGYKPVSEKIQEEAKALMKKHNVQISA